MNEKKPANPWTKSLLIWMAMLFGLVLFVQTIGGSRASRRRSAMPYSEFVKPGRRGQCPERHHRRASPSGNSAITGKLDDGKTFTHHRARPTPTCPTG